MIADSMYKEFMNCVHFIETHNDLNHITKLKDFKSVFEDFFGNYIVDDLSKYHIYFGCDITDDIDELTDSYDYDCDYSAYAKNANKLDDDDIYYIDKNKGIAYVPTKYQLLFVLSHVFNDDFVANRACYDKSTFSFVQQKNMLKALDCPIINYSIGTSVKNAYVLRELRDCKHTIQKNNLENKHLEHAINRFKKLSNKINKTNSKKTLKNKAKVQHDYYVNLKKRGEYLVCQANSAIDDLKK